ncbi:MAG: Valine-tRNA ligase [Candidatus Beckwithbacteria bacterium GW2011_GWA2_43_10]|uniref:Valine--tRNA ligase n=1 Tax=Candidatus Beckwithbacteria bacterium GW2011_GWA2_43_10 TaxID=1618369 RepID=A0A0G1EB87_9BACT|nr:MAG: Valine-tRNA ligase [Candidatus Beckwithbacteria bacterium GW2011_GWA2_43_10]
MPPPNANDPLHVGHAMFVTVEDIFIRYQRMLGKSVLWLPGTDHAGIETQYVFEKKLKKEGKSRFDFDRKTLYRMIWDYVQENSGTAIIQMKKLGASADWTRTKFTLDKDIVEQVTDTFIKLYKDGLVYKDLKLVNFCTKCGTAFSNLEVKHVEEKNKLYYVKYKLTGGGFIAVATTRPETIFADMAIAINPKHKLAKKLKGKKAINPLTRKEMPLIEDRAVKLKFGTGMLKITPFHDQTDWEIWKRHEKELASPRAVIDENGRMTKDAGKYAGLKTHIAREEVIKELDLEKIDNNYQNSVGKCYRCGRVIEPLPLPQFFIKVKPLTEKVLAALKKGEVKIYGSGHDKILKYWLENLEDWNISRQIVWGIRMPVWYEKTDFVVSRVCPGKGYVQETDTFDTWFSSAQWPVVTLKTRPGDFEKFYPTDIMETGYDILPFWVMRMLMIGVYLTGKVPFEKVYLHGLVRDEKGQKMSKSKGNVINPVEVVEKYGADALRMALVMSTTAGQDSAVGEGKIRGMRNLTNKIWNAARFIIMNRKRKTKNEKRKTKDKIFKQKLIQIIKQVSKQLNDLKPGLAAETVYNEFWHWFCDEKIEEAKEGKISQKTLLEGLRIFLKLLHPFVPFVTEAVWQQLPRAREKMLISSLWPN